MHRAEALPAVRHVPVDNAIALRSVQLEGLPPDPADRIVAATASGLGASLVTKDRRRHHWTGIETVW